MKKLIASIAVGAVGIMLSVSVPGPASAYYRAPAVHFTPRVSAPRYVPVQRFNRPVQHFNRPVQHFNRPVQHFNRPVQHFNQRTVVHRYPGGSPGGPLHHRNINPTPVKVGHGPHGHFRFPHYAAHVHHGGRGSHPGRYGRWRHWYGGWGYGALIDPSLIDTLISEAIIDWDWSDGSAYFTAAGNCYFMDASGAVYAADPAACGG